MSNPTDPQCEYCNAFHDYGDGYGECRAVPAMRAIVRGTDWCREFKQMSVWTTVKCGECKKLVLERNDP